MHLLNHLLISVVKCLIKLSFLSIFYFLILKRSVIAYHKRRLRFFLFNLSFIQINNVYVINMINYMQDSLEFRGSLRNTVGIHMRKIIYKWSCIRDRRDYKLPVRKTNVCSMPNIASLMRSIPQTAVHPALRSWFIWP